MMHGQKNIKLNNDVLCDIPQARKSHLLRLPGIELILFHPSTNTLSNADQLFLYFFIYIYNSIYSV